MIKTSLSQVPRTIAFLLTIHIFAATGFTGTVPVKRKHRRVSATHKQAVRRPAKARVKPVSVTATVPGNSFRAQKAAIAGPRPVAPAGPIIAGGPWTSPTYADSTFGDNVDGEDLDIRRAAVDALGQY